MSQAGEANVNRSNFEPRTLNPDGRYLHPPADPRVGLLARPDPRGRWSPFRPCPWRSTPRWRRRRSRSRAFYTGANAQEVETAVTTPLEQAINGVEGMLYMTSSSTNTGVATINVTFDITRDQDLAQIDVQNRVNQALGRMPAEVRTTGITVQKQTTGFVMAVGVYSEKAEYDSLFLSNYLDVYVQGRAEARPRRRRRADLRRAQVRDAPVARSGPHGRAAPDRGGRGLVAARAERAGGRRQPRPGAGAGRPDVSAQRPRRRPAARGVGIREHHPQERRRRFAGPRARRGPRRARRRDLLRAAALPGGRSRRLRRQPAADRECARRRARRVRGNGTALARSSRRASSTRSPSTPPTSSRSRSTRSSRRWPRRSRWWCSSSSSSCRPGAARSSRRSPSRCR